MSARYAPHMCDHPASGGFSAPVRPEAGRRDSRSSSRSERRVALRRIRAVATSAHHTHPTPGGHSSVTSSDRDRPADPHDHNGHAFARREPSPAPPMRLADAAELVLVASAPRLARFDRDDLVMRKGQYALRNGHMTPRESMVEDLLAVGDALDEAGIAFLLVRGNDERPLIAVDRTERKAVARAFGDAFANEPFYAATLAPERAADATPCCSPTGGSRRAASPPSCASTGRASNPSAACATAARPPCSSSSGGSATTRSRRRSRTRSCGARCPRSEAIDDIVHLHGRDWPTLEHMFDAARERRGLRHRHGVLMGRRFERRVRARARASACRATSSARATTPRPDSARSTSSSTRCARCTCSPHGCGASSSRPTPRRRAGSRSIRRSRSCAARRCSPTPSVLPTHNSHAVESQLHSIAGLAEHFLYSNDDMFFGRPISPDAVLLARRHHEVRRGVDAHRARRSHPGRSGFENAARVNRALLRDRFGKVTTRHLEHCAAPLRRASWPSSRRRSPRSSPARRRAGSARRPTSRSRTRCTTTTRCSPGTRSCRPMRASSTSRPRWRGAARDAALLKRRDQDMFCLNDGSFPEISVEERTAAVIEFLERYFPFPAPWEKTTDAATRVAPATATSAPTVTA